MKITTSHSLLVVDPSLKMSGWALFSLENGLPHAVGVLCSQDPEIALSERLTHLQKDVENLFSTLHLQKEDILVCEGPGPLVRNPSSALKIERVRGIFEAMARQRGVLVPGRINPRTVQTELLGMGGKQVSRIVVKESARVVARRLYHDILPPIAERWLSKRHAKKIPQDIVDALLIGALTVPRLQRCLQAGIDINIAFLPRYHIGRRTPRRRVTGGWRQLSTTVSQRKLCES